MKMPVLLSLALLILSFSGVGLAQGAGLARCRTISEPAGRLACYDALPVQSTEKPPAMGSGRPAPAPQAPPSLLERFGLESRAPQADRIESHIPGRFQGWKANSLIRLANGQVWKVVDGTWLHGEWDSPKVVVRRGMLGSFHLDIEGENRSPRVQRVQ